MEPERNSKHKAGFVKLDMESEVQTQENDRANLLVGGPYVNVYEVEDHMLGSVLSCIFCCTTIGILAIVRSMQVRDYKVMGNGALAQIAAKSAKKMIRLSVIFGVLALACVVLYSVGMLMMVSRINAVSANVEPGA